MAAEAQQQAPLLPGLVVFDLDYTLWPLWVDTHVRPPLQAHPTGDGTAIDANGQKVCLFREVHLVIADLQAKGIPIGVASRTSAPEEARKLMSLLHLRGCRPLAGHGHANGGSSSSHASASSSAATTAATGREARQAAGVAGSHTTSGAEVHSKGSGAGAVPAPTTVATLSSVVSFAQIYPGDKKAHFAALASDSGVSYSDMIFFDDESRNIVSVGGGLGVHAVHIDEEQGLTWAVYTKALQDWRDKRRKDKGR